MILFVNDKSEIHDVGSTKDTTLVSVYVDENNDEFPFKGMSSEAICCYKVTVEKGIIIMATPYKDSRLIGPIDDIGHKIDEITPYKATQELSCGDTEAWFADVPDGNLTVSIKDSEGNYPECSAVREDDVIKVVFEPLEYAADITITIQ